MTIFFANGHDKLVAVLLITFGSWDFLSRPFLEAPDFPETLNQ